MAAIRSLRRAVGALTDNPVLFLVGVAFALVLAPQTTLSLVGSLGGSPLGGASGLLANVLQLLSFFVTVFLLAGLLGMAREALGGTTSFDTLTRVGKDRYVPLLLGSVVRFGIALVSGILALIVGVIGVMILMFVVGFGAMAGAGGGGSVLGAVGIVGIVLGALLAVVVLLVLLVPAFFVQFYAVAIAADGADAIEGFKRSVGLVRRNFLSTLGYWLIQSVVGVVTSLPVFGFVAFRFWQRMQATGGMVGSPGSPGSPATTGGLLSLPEVLALVAVALLLQVLLKPFQQTYATAFYDETLGLE